MREMGKAMMGTGEAPARSVHDRGRAAIANPRDRRFLDEGRPRLLISITGGRDLTLFEVDEAATRNSREVDQDANIIVGATLDEDPRRRDPRLVVATGIEQALISAHATTPAAIVTNAVPRPPRRTTVWPI